MLPAAGYLEKRPNFIVSRDSALLAMLALGAHLAEQPSLTTGLLALNILANSYAAVKQRGAQNSIRDVSRFFGRVTNAVSGAIFGEPKPEQRSAKKLY